MAGNGLSGMVRRETRFYSLYVFGFDLGLFLVAASPLHGDGMFFSEKAYKTPPAIPTQRALLIYKNGVENLIVESSFEGSGKTAGWILPLPARPTKMDKADPDLLKWLSFQIQPHVIHDSPEKIKNVAAIALGISLWALLLRLEKPKSRTYIALTLFPLAFLILFFLEFDFDGYGAGVSLGENQGPTKAFAGVNVLETSMIGNYDVTVLQADNPQALNAWLDQNGFVGLNKTGKEIVSDYIRDKWCFVTAKLRREGPGLTTPHPLHLTFPTAAPVYPMRLTALAQTPVYLELFIVGDQPAVADPLEVEIRDIFEKESYYSRIGTSETFYQQWPGPALVEEWSKFWVTKLSGTLKPRAMKKDILIQWRAGRPYQATYYTRPGARDTGLLWALILWCVATPLALTARYNGVTWPKNLNGCFLWKVFIPITLLALAVWATVYFAAPKVDSISYTDFILRVLPRRY